MSLESTAWVLAHRKRVTVAEIIHAHPGFDVRKDVSRLIDEKGWAIDKEYAEGSGAVTYVLVRIGRVDFKAPRFDWGPYQKQRDYIPGPWSLGAQERLF